jgi:hypothetical protein
MTSRTKTIPTVLQRQLARVSRRLFLQTLLDCLVWCWAGALAVSAVWFLLQPFLIESPPDWLRWAVAGGLAGAGAVLAVVLACVWAPSRLAAALSLDERFGLKERVTTMLTLGPGVEATPAGQALLEDATQKVTGINVGERFPVRFRWSAVTVPVGAVVLALIALFYEPPLSQATSTADKELKQPPANKEEIEKKLQDVAKKLPPKKPEDKDKSRDIQKIEAELRELVNRPRDNREQLRDRAQEMTQLEAEMKKQQKLLQEKADAMKEQLRQLGKMSDKDKDENRMTKELEKALAKGDFDQAKEEVEKLAKKLKDDELKDDEKEQLKKQIQDLKDKLERIAKQEDEEERLKDLAKKGELDPEALERELQNLKKKSDELKDLEEIAKELGECQKCMGKGDKEGAAKSLKEAAQKMRRMKLDDQQLQDLKEQLQALQECKNCMGNGMNKSKRPGGRRPEDKEGDYKPLDNRVRVEFDKSGQKEILDFVPGRTYKKKSSAEIAGEVKQASQEAPEAIERQRIPRAASEMAKGYYEKLRQQSEPEKKDKP